MDTSRGGEVWGVQSSRAGCGRRVWLAVGVLALSSAVVQAQSAWITGITPAGASSPVYRNGDTILYDSQIMAYEIEWDYDTFDWISNRTVLVNGQVYYHAGSGPASIPVDLLQATSSCAPLIQLRITGVMGFTSRTVVTQPVQLYVDELPQGGCLPRPTECELTLTGQGVGGPVDVATGEMWYQTTDLRLGGAFPLEFGRVYRSTDHSDGPLGVGWTHSYDLRLVGAGSAFATYEGADGRRIAFAKRETGAYYPNRHARMALSAVTGGYELSDPVSVTTYAFDSAGKLVSITNRDGLSQTLTYDGSGRLQTVSGPHGRALVLSYDGNGRLASAQGTPAGPAVQYAVDDVAGKLDSFTDALGHSWQYRYEDALHPHLMTEVVDPLGHTVESHGYDAAGRCVLFRRHGDADRLEIAGYGTVQRTVTRYIATDPLETAVTTYTIDPTLSMVTSVSGAGCGCGAGESRSYTWSRWFDKLTETDGEGRVTRYEYYTFSDGEPGGSATSYSRGTVWRTTEAYGTPSARVTTYSYGAGNGGYHATATGRASVGSPGETTTTILVRDPASRRVLQEVRSGWLEPGVSEEHTTTFAYQHGQLAMVDGPRTDVADVTTTSFHDVTAAAVADRGLPYQLVDPVGGTTTYMSYNLYGQPTVVVDRNGVTATHVYDAKGRRLSSTVEGSPPLTTSWVYDDADRLVEMVKPAGNRVVYGYDAAGRMVTTALADAAGNQLERMLFTYDLRGLRLEERAERCESPAPACALWQEGRRTSFGYDEFGRRVRVDHPDGSRVLYDYDGAGNLIGLTDERHASPNAVYGYDEFDRMVTVSQTLSTAPGGVVTTTYGYDVHGNLSSVEDPEGNVTTYATDDFGRPREVVSAATGMSSFAHDPAGNLTAVLRASGRVTGRSYDALNRPVEETANGEVVKSWFWDQGDHGVGRLASSMRVSHDEKVTRSYSYDREGMSCSWRPATAQSGTG